MADEFNFEEAGRLPMAGDNVAIAGRRLEAGARIRYGGGFFEISHTVLEGHRFAVKPIAAGEALLSWELKFGEAVRPIAPGDYVCNTRILAALAGRNIDFKLPERENFKDYLVRHEFDEAAFRPGRQIERLEDGLTFSGFARGGGRGVGTRNFIAVLAASSRAAGYARLLAGRMQEAAGSCPNVDGIVAVTHTEGGGEKRPNNLDFILRTLSGFIVHPNVAAVLIVDYGTEAVTNDLLREFMESAHYPLADVPHRFLSISGDFGETLAEGERILRAWLPQADACRREPHSLSHLKLALQCGGSDAFSGISGNPLAGWVAKEVIRRGGSANLAETDELIGAERYVLENVRDLETARAFLRKIDIFKERAGWHGQSVEGNPSSGNNFRGLYNICLKSIGAARKRDPEVRLDYVIDYGATMEEPGYYFMDSPGNDLESIAGQVASGSNMILFITGNGSITNFPFVPTIKIMTTSERFGLLSQDMDINAGRFQDGTPMETLGGEAFEYALEIASGRASVGEAAGHSQVSIWRDWAQTSGERLEGIRATAEPSGEPLPLRRAAFESATAPATAESLGTERARSFPAFKTAGGYASDRVGLIVPSSLCSGEIARMIADRLNAHNRNKGVSRFVALVHTEGCGAAGGDSEEIFLRTMVNHLRHPFVKKALLLEHGCEKTVNDYIRNYMEEQGLEPENFGWASVQLDGGIERVMAKVAEWFGAELASPDPEPTEEIAVERLRLAMTATGETPPVAAEAMARLAAAVVAGGGTVVLPSNASLLSQPAFVDFLFDGLSPETAPPEGHSPEAAPPAPSLAYGQAATRPGLHVMDTPSSHPVEALTGLGGTGVEIMLAHLTGHPLQAHPMIPLVQVSGDALTTRRWHRDLDLVFDPEKGSAAAIMSDLLELLRKVAAREYTPRLYGQGNTDFQMTRGRLGISM